MNIEVISVLYSLIINIINTFFSIYVIKKAINLEWNKFFKRIVLSIMIRTGIILTVFLGIIKLFLVDLLTFSLSFIIFFFLFLIFEILYLNKSLRFRNFV